MMEIPLFSTILVEPGCTAEITMYGDVRIKVCMYMYIYMHNMCVKFVLCFFHNCALPEVRGFLPAICSR